MKTKGIANLYRPKKIIYHIKIILFAFLFVLILSTINGNGLLSNQSIYIFFLLFLQLEAFIGLGNMFFKFNPGKTKKEITRNILIRFLYFYLACFVVAALIFTGISFVMYIIQNEDISQLIPNLINTESKGWLIGTNFGLFIGSIIFFFLQWQDAMGREQKLKEENLIFQNETLKQQVNPHFLFNSLNTLSSLVPSNPDVAERFISKLSSIYRYTLENSSKDKVSLQSEIDFIKDFFYLHKIRDEEKIVLELDIPETNEMEILPVSLQSLIENALKHNMATREKPLVIRIYLENNYVVVQNDLQKMSTVSPSSKIGLKNLAERIRLMTGKELKVQETSNEYIVKIPLM